MILLDEIEKAHPEVWNVLLQVMDDGRLTDGEGRTVDFTNAVIVMTSNLGAGKAKRGIGFTAGEPAAEAARMEDAAKQAFLPEFINRIDEIVTFESLTPDARRADRGPDGRAAWPTGCSPSAASRSRSTRSCRRSSPATASTRPTAPARCSATSAARWRRP